MEIPTINPPRRTLARIEIDEAGTVAVASHLPPGPLVAALAAALTQVAGYIPEPATAVETIDARTDIADALRIVTATEAH